MANYMENQTNAKGAIMFPTLMPGKDRKEIEQLKLGYVSLTQDELIKQVRDLKRKERQLKFNLAEVQIQIQAITESSLELFKEWDINKIKTQIGSLSVSQGLHCLIKDRDSVISWCEDNKPDILKLDFNWQSFNAMVKVQVNSNGNYPSEADGIEIYNKPSIRFSGI